DVLGELRYQPRPLHLPQNFSKRRRTLVPALAIAATLLLAVAIGLWLNLNRRWKQPPLRQAAGSPPEPGSPTPKSTTQQTQTVTVHDTQKPKQSERRQLMALRMVSAKLNLAQRKSVGVPQTNIIRNQHKVG